MMTDFERSISDIRLFYFGLYGAAVAFRVPVERGTFNKFLSTHELKQNQRIYFKCGQCFVFCFFPGKNRMSVVFVLLTVDICQIKNCLSLSI